MPEHTTASAAVWRVETMRLTAFPAAGPRPVPGTFATWWLTLFGAPHETSTQDLKKGVTQLRGAVGDVFIVATENPVSFEWRRFSSDPSEPPPPPDTFPLLTDAAPAFQEVALRWLTLDDRPPLRRLAFGATLLNPVADITTGNEILNRHLPDVKVDPGSSDFLYQINRRRPSAVVAALLLNRLSKWSIQYVNNLVIEADGAMVRQPETIACRLDLDMNSVPSGDTLPQEHLHHLFMELLTLASDIARDGDIS